MKLKKNTIKKYPKQINIYKKNGSQIRHKNKLKLNIEDEIEKKLIRKRIKKSKEWILNLI